jgi:spore coat polysaccharide biosynthesis protein SpsF
MSKRLQKGCIGIIARLGSTRLPDKHLLLINGQPILTYLVKRIKNEFINELENSQLDIIVLSGDPVKNSALGTFAMHAGISIYFGDDSNIPKRINEAVEKFNYKFIVSVDGDDILCSPSAMRAVYEELVISREYIQTQGLPFGMNVTGFSSQFLAESLSRINVKHLETGWGWIFDAGKLKGIEYSLKFPKYLRFTLDYLDDFKFFKEILSTCKNWVKISDQELVNFVLKNKIFRFNKDLMDKYWENFNDEQNKEKVMSNG